MSHIVLPQAHIHVEETTILMSVFTGYSFARRGYASMVSRAPPTAGYTRLSLTPSTLSSFLFIGGDEPCGPVNTSYRLIQVR